MNILVIGCDQVGASLIRDLERIGHDISLIERDPEQLKRLDAFDDYRFGGTALVGDPTDPDVLKQGGIENCDAVAAVSEDDSVNLMAAQIAKSIFQREYFISFNSCSRSWKYSGQKNSSTVIFRPSQSFLTVATVVVWFRPLIMLLSVDCVTPLRMLKRLIVILRSSHSAKMRRRTASPTVITITPLSFH